MIRHSLSSSSKKTPLERHDDVDDIPSYNNEKKKKVKESCLSICYFCQSLDSTYICSSNSVISTTIFPNQSFYKDLRSAPAGHQAGTNERKAEFANHIVYSTPSLLINYLNCNPPFP